MIHSFRHRGLEKFWATSSVGGIVPSHADRIERILDALDAATLPQDMNIPGYKFHPLQGKRKGSYAVTVSGNWRITFRWRGTDAVDIDYEDYH